MYKKYNNTKLSDEDFKNIINVFKAIYDNRNNPVNDLYNFLTSNNLETYDIIRYFNKFKNFNLNIVSNLTIILDHMINSYRNEPDEVNEVYYEYLDTVDFYKLFEISLDDIDKKNFDSKMDELEKNMNIVKTTEYVKDMMDKNLKIDEYCESSNISTTHLKKLISNFLAYNPELYINFYIYYNDLKPISNEDRMTLLDSVTKDYNQIANSLMVEKEKILDKKYDKNDDILTKIKKLERYKAILEQDIDVLSLRKFYQQKNQLKIPNEEYQLVYELNSVLRAKSKLFKSSKNNLELIYKLYDEKMFI